MKLALTKARVHRFQDEGYIRRRFDKLNQRGIAFTFDFRGSLLVVEAYEVANDERCSFVGQHVHFLGYNGHQCSRDIYVGSNRCVIHVDDLSRHEKAIYLTIKLIQSQGVK